MFSTELKTLCESRSGGQWRVSGERAAAMPRVKALWSDAQLVLACGGLGRYYHPEGDGGVCRTHLWRLCVAFEHVTWVTCFLLALG